MSCYEEFLDFYNVLLFFIFYFFGDTTSERIRDTIGGEINK